MKAKDLIKQIEKVMKKEKDVVIHIKGKPAKEVIVLDRASFYKKGMAYTVIEIK
jgi:hypothetical protein